ncbi:MAG: PilZ domain-containing protein [Rubrivivax sp.]|nr:MAG: PilZ domain-containing protein [Rubrivivax sp.]
MRRLPPLATEPSDSTHTSTAANSRRTDIRMAIRHPVALVMADGSTRQATTIDISQRGLSLTTDKPVAPGSKCRVVIQGTPGAQTAMAEIAAKAVYSSYVAAKHFRIGLTFHVTDSETAAFVQTLMAAALRKT